MKRSGLGQIKDTISIRDRPAEVEDRAVPGHHCRQGIQSMPERGEGDLIAGSGNSYIATLVERHTVGGKIAFGRIPEADDFEEATGADGDTHFCTF
jgi:IS30 family transposase